MCVYHVDSVACICIPTLFVIKHHYNYKINRIRYLQYNNGIYIHATLLLHLNHQH